MIKVLFICHGNICRSPMAEFIFKDLIQKHGLSNQFYAASAATSSEEIGNPVYPPAKRKLAEHGISCEGKRAVRMKKEDYEKYDLLIGAEQVNVRNMERITGGDPEGKMCRLLDYSAHPRDISDPWYTGDFEKAYQDILEGCEALLEHLCSQK
jgi:protein-tyrosine phosphatase